MSDLHKYEDYVRCFIAFQHVCDSTVKECVEKSVTDWHNVERQPGSGNLGKCITATKCPSTIKNNKKRQKWSTPSDPPWFPPSCSICKSSGIFIENIYYGARRTCRPAESKIVWSNINPVKFNVDPVETAKVFALEFPIDASKMPRSFGDFDAAGLLKILMRFPACFKNKSNVGQIKQVGLYTYVACPNKTLQSLHTRKI